MKAAYPDRYNMAAGYNEFFRAHLYLVFKFNQIIAKKIFTNDRAGLKTMNGIIKQGGIMTFSPFLFLICIKPPLWFLLYTTSEVYTIFGTVSSRTWNPFSV